MLVVRSVGGEHQSLAVGRYRFERAADHGFHGESEIAQLVDGERVHGRVLLALFLLPLRVLELERVYRFDDGEPEALLYAERGVDHGAHPRLVHLDRASGHPCDLGHGAEAHAHAFAGLLQELAVQFDVQAAGGGEYERRGILQEEVRQRLVRDNGYVESGIDYPGFQVPGARALPDDQRRGAKRIGKRLHLARILLREGVDVAEDLYDQDLAVELRHDVEADPSDREG